MKDMLGNVLRERDLVAYAARRGSSSAIFVAMVVDTKKNGILSGRCGWGSEEFSVNSKPGYGVESNKLILIEGYDEESGKWEEIWGDLNEVAEKYIDKA